MSTLPDKYNSTQATQITNLQTSFNNMEPIISAVAPVNGSDTGVVGKIWIETPINRAYMLVNNVSNTWKIIAS